MTQPESRNCTAKDHEIKRELMSIAHWNYEKKEAFKAGLYAGVKIGEQFAVSGTDALDAARYRCLRSDPSMLLHLKSSEFDAALDARLLVLAYLKRTAP